MTANPLTWPQTVTAGRNILEDINTSSSPRRNACSCQIKKVPNARPGQAGLGRVLAGENDGKSQTVEYTNARAESIVLRQ